MALQVDDVFITEELTSRPVPAADYLREKLALQDIARQMAEHPAEVLPRLVTLAMEICEADSAGISLFEPQPGTAGVFRWHHLVGVLEKFTGATTPRDFSPCGICLDQQRATLSRNPERVYDWIADAGIVVPEVLLVPLYARGESLGTLWVVAKEGQQFNSGHARVLTELAAFAGLAYRMVEAEQHLTLALDHQQAVSQEMSHRVKNLFAITDGLVAASARSAQTSKDMAKILSGRLNALARAHGIVRNIGTIGASGVPSGDLEDLVRTVLQPYDTGASVKISGDRLGVSQRAINALALVLHELATNAAKYGAFSGDRGIVTAAWQTSGRDIVLNWVESGGPRIESVPVNSGFGTEITRKCVEQIGGKIAHDWKPDGLRVTITVPSDRLQ
jgi:two-component sensor histidine kinase